MASKTGNKEDPRNETLAVSYHAPKGWSADSDATSSLALLLAGAAMLTRNPHLAWPAMFCGMNAYINQRPLSLKEGGQAVISIFAALGCLLVTNLPRLLIRSKPVPI